MRLLCVFAVHVFLSEATLVFAVPMPRDKPNPKEPGVVKKKEVGPVEIDFSRLPKEAPVDYRLKLILDFENVEGPSVTKYKIGKGTDPDSIINLIQATLPTVDMKQVGAKLIVKGYKGHRVLKAGIKIEGIPKKHTPTVRRMPEKKK